MLYSHHPLKQHYSISFLRPPEGWRTFQSWSFLFLSKEDFSFSLPFLKAFFSSAIKRRAISWKGKQTVRRFHRSWGFELLISFSLLCQTGTKPGLLKSAIRDQMPEQKWNGLHVACPFPDSPICVSRAFLPFVSFPSMLSSSCSISDNLLTGSVTGDTLLQPHSSFLCHSCNRQHSPAWLTWTQTQKSARNKPH